MKDIILKAENISKQYRLGLVGTGTISHDLNRWWYKIRGKEDPYLKIGESNDRSTKGSSDYVWALKDINFEVKRGEVLGIIGKNGAGKSTLLKILSKVTGPTTGEIKTKGRIASLLEVGTGFHGEMTGRENIYLNGAILGMTKKEIGSKIGEIIEFSGCQRYIDTPVKRYSSGMTVRLAFAVAAFLEPEILVIDEVLAVGDAEFQKKAIGKMQDISQGEGRTVLFVSHNMAAVKKLCTRGIVLENGMVSFNGEVEKAIDYYLEGSNTDFTITEFKNRQGTGIIKIKKVFVFGENKDCKPQTGKPFTISFLLENDDNVSLKDIDFDIRIDDNLGQRISWLSSSLLTIPNKSNVKRVDFLMGSLQLNDGIYYVTTHISVKKIISDWIHNAFSFHVEQGCYYEEDFFVPTIQSKSLLNFNIEVYDSEKIKQLIQENRMYHKENLSVLKELDWANIYHDSICGKQWLKNLPLNVGRWAGGYPLFYVLNRILNDYKPNSILELGLGESTKFISAYLDNLLLKSNHLVIEHNLDWKKTFLELNTICDRTVISIASLKKEIIKNQEVIFYDGLDNIVDKKYDLYLIDGPIGSPHFSRYDVLSLVKNLSKDDEFIIIIDDYNRKGERETTEDLIELLVKKEIKINKAIYEGSKHLIVITTEKYKYATTL